MDDPGRAGRSATDPRLAALLAAAGVLVLIAVVLWLGQQGGTPGATGSPSPRPAASPTVTEAGGTPTPTESATLTFSVETFPVPAGSDPHDVAPAADGGVWYTAQRSGELGWIGPFPRTYGDPVLLGEGSAPHGVILGPDGAPWITDGGLNAILRVDPATQAVTTFSLPLGSPNVGLNTAAFDGDGILWFTGNAGYLGRLDPATGKVRLFDAPRGAGPYGITATPEGEIYFASLQGNYLGGVDRTTGEVRVIEPPTPGAGVRRCWSDSEGRIWVSEWNAGQVGVYDPATDAWREWRLPGDSPMAYAVFVDESGAAWLSDFRANAIVRFDPVTESFTSVPLPDDPAEVRQLNGRPGEVWGAESAADTLVLIRQ